MALERVGTLRRIETALVSGRGIDDLIRKVGIEEATYAGAHGFDIQRHGRRWRHPKAAEAQGLMSEIATLLGPQVDHIPESEIENKGSTLSIHYRRVADPRQADDLQAIALDVAQPWLTRDQIRVTTGKMVMELRPPVSWGKGHALAFMIAGEDPSAENIVMDESGAYVGGTDGRLPVYIGDDQTDEDGFRAIARVGIPVKVGDPGSATAAKYYLRSTYEVCESLELVASALA